MPSLEPVRVDCVVQKMHWTMDTMSLFTNRIQRSVAYGCIAMNLVQPFIVASTKGFCKIFPLKMHLSFDRIQIRIFIQDKSSGWFYEIPRSSVSTNAAIVCFSWGHPCVYSIICCQIWFISSHSIPKSSCQRSPVTRWSLGGMHFGFSSIIWTFFSCLNFFQVFSKDLRNNICESKQFDRIFICNGHYTVPYIPPFDGLDEFVGQTIHSHDYRRPDQFENETVLLIGSGPSGKFFEISFISRGLIKIQISRRHWYHVWNCNQSEASHLE